MQMGTAEKAFSRSRLGLHFPLLFNNQLFQKLQVVLLSLGKD
jgi:hypothetical protein